jgi:hypothetical protein
VPRDEDWVSNFGDFGNPRKLPSICLLSSSAGLGTGWKANEGLDVFVARAPSANPAHPSAGNGRQKINELTPDFKKRALPLRISEDISKAIGKMCDLERSTSTAYHQQFFIR